MLILQTLSLPTWTANTKSHFIARIMRLSALTASGVIEDSNFIQKWLDDEYQVVQRETLQSNDSTVCGQYCMFFVLLRAYGFSYQDILSALTTYSSANGKFVCRFINKFFKLSTTIKEKKCLLSKLLKISKNKKPP